MGQVTVRTSLTSHGFIGLNPWLGGNSPYCVSAINKGNNPITYLEVVSALNSFNLASHLYHYNTVNCPMHYNPKVYLGAVQSVANGWNSDNNMGLPGSGKSGSWPLLNAYTFCNF